MNKTHDTAPAGEPVPAFFIREHLFGVSQDKYASILTAASRKKDPSANRSITQSAIARWELGGGISRWWSSIIREEAKARQAKGLLKRDWRDEYLHADGIPVDGYKPPAAHGVRRSGPASGRGASGKAGCNPINRNDGAHRTIERVGT